MTSEQFSREKNYQVAVAIARAMLKNGTIDTGDFDKMEAAFGIKFCPCIGVFQGANP